MKKMCETEGSTNLHKSEKSWGRMKSDEDREHTRVSGTNRHIHLNYFKLFRIKLLSGYSGSKILPQSQGDQSSCFAGDQEASLDPKSLVLKTGAVLEIPSIMVWI
jgi:hypothetical protein